MADERTDEMTSSAIEREIAQALAVDPSPEFVARVRMRVASEPAPRRGWWMPVLVGATAITAAVTIAVVAPWRGSQVQLKPDSTTSTETRDKTLPADAVAPGFGRTKTSQAETRVRLKPDPTAVGSQGVGSGFSRTVTEPEVLVPQAEIEMYRRLIASVNALEPVALLEPPREFAADLEPPSELTIDPIKIEPIPPPSGEGERR